MTFPLPKFTFLYGPNTEPLAKALVDACKPAMSKVCDLLDPINRATIDLFFEENVFTDISKEPLIPFGPMRMEDWKREFNNFLCTQFGNSILGQIAFKSLVENADHEVFRHIIYTNFGDYPEIDPFLHHFSDSDCVIVNAGPLNYRWPGTSVRIINLAKPDDIPNSLTQIERELGGVSVHPTP